MSNIAHLSPEDISKWPTPNYENPDRLTWMPAYSSIWFISATLLFGMRCWLRVRGHAGRLGLDDVRKHETDRRRRCAKLTCDLPKAILLPGWLAGLWFTVVTMLYTEWGGSLHVWDVPPEKRTSLVLCMWLGEFSFLVCGGCTKVSILLFYRRLVGGTYSRRYKWLIWFAIAFTIAYTVVFCIILLVNCTPTEAYWMAFDFKYALTADYTCMDTSVINTMAGVCAAISDVYAVALPCILTWQLSSVPKRQKIALFGIFSLGLVVVAASGVRTYWLIRESILYRLQKQPLTSNHRNQQSPRSHKSGLQPFRLGPIRATSRNHMRLRTLPPSLLPPLSRRQQCITYNARDNPQPEQKPRHWHRHKDQQSPPQRYCSQRHHGRARSERHLRARLDRVDRVPQRHRQVAHGSQADVVADSKRGQ